MKRLSSLDAGFLHIESNRVFSYVGATVVLENSRANGALDLETLTELVASRLHLLPVLRRRLAEVPFGLGGPYWVEDESFDLDYHIRESAIPPPGTDRQLADMVARTFGRPLDRSRPLWELWLVHGLKSGESVLLTKFHHALVDGVSGNEVLTVLLDLTAEGREIQPALSRKPERVPAKPALLAHGLADLAQQATRSLRLAPQSVPRLLTMPGATIVPGLPRITRALAALPGRPPPSRSMLEVTTARAPKTPFSRPLTPHRRWAFARLPLARVKAIKNAATTLGTGPVTLNDVVVTMCAGAARAWLIEHHALPSEPLIAAVPISVRGKGDSYGNQIGIMSVPIGTHIADPAERLARNAEALGSAKEVHGALPAEMLTDSTNFLPPAIAALAARNAMNLLSRVRPPMNLLISNVPGPRTPLYLSGRQMTGYYPVPPIMDGVGLNFTVTSYLDELLIGIMTDRGAIEDAWPLTELFVESLDELEEAVQKASGARTTKAAKRTPAKAAKRTPAVPK